MSESAPAAIDQAGFRRILTRNIALPAAAGLDFVELLPPAAGCHHLQVIPAVAPQHNHRHGEIVPLRLQCSDPCQPVYLRLVIADLLTLRVGFRVDA